MFHGRLVGIYMTGEKGTPLQAVEHAEAVAGHGLLGDRYYLDKGTWSKPEYPDREVTLIESEALAGLEREYNVRLEPAQARRNLVTAGVALNHLVGREFTVGGVVLRGIRLCEPCAHLEGLTCQGVKKGLVHRGGLRAQILRGGILRSGDAIEETQPADA